MSVEPVEVTSGLRRAGGVLAIAIVLVAAVGSALTAAVYLTDLQEVSARWMGYAGVSSFVAFVCACVATLGAVLALFVRRHRWIVAVAVVPWLLVAQMASATVRGLVLPERSAGGHEFSVLAQNLWYKNDDPARTADILFERNADVLVLTELTDDHAAVYRSERWRNEYPYRWVRPAEYGDGIAVLSRLPFADQEQVELSSPALRVDLEVGERTVALFAVHPISPSENYSIPNWQRDYELLLREVADMGPDTIVAGDFNATTGHRRFRQLARVGDLRDAQDAAGVGFAATWPTGGLLPPLMRLDHILVGPGIGVVDFEVLDDAGSDHRGVESRLQVPRS